MLNIVVVEIRPEKGGPALVKKAKPWRGLGFIFGFANEVIPLYVLALR